LFIIVNLPLFLFETRFWLSCFLFFFSSRRRHTRYWRDWSSDVCSSDLGCPDRRDHELEGRLGRDHQLLSLGEAVRVRDRVDREDRLGRDTELLTDRRRR